ncbi:hypothetical protein [Staphylococcus shinii]|uniref:hypothetical protein n=1 Tax=Staphylococcus shinii TaxID=2912228 RepID=UPI003F57E5F9
MRKFVQNIEELQNFYNKQEIESKKYRGHIPKKKRIRNKIQSKRENEKFVFDEFHIIGTAGEGKSQHYDENGKRVY